MLDRLPATGRPFAARLRCAALLAAILACSAARIAEAQRLPITLYSTREGLPHYVVNRIVADSRGFLWFCTREGLARYDGHEFVAFGTEQGLPSATVNDIVEARDGTHWIGTTAGLVRFDPGRHPHFTTVGIGPDRGVPTQRPVNVAALALDPSGDVWVGTTTGLHRARPGAPAGTKATYVDLAIPHAPTPPGIASLLVDREGGLWIAAGNRLFRRAANGTIEQLGKAEGLPVGSITDMLQDRTGRIWLATWAGLHRVDTGPEGTPRVGLALDERHGLPSPLVSSLLQDSRGSLWAGTNLGLVEIRLDRNASVAGTRLVDEEEGLPGREIQGLAEDTHGNVWLGVSPFGVAKLSSNGFTSFGLPAPRTFPSSERPVAHPRTVINAVSVAGRDYPVSATPARTADRIAVPAGATFRVEFGAPWFGAPGNLTYEYRLEGLDRDWIGAAGARSVSYAGIAPGSYTLEIRALANGVPSPEVVTVPFTVVPPLWRRPAFLLPLAVAAALLGYAAYRLRLRRALELANMRTRIATDLHDDIGADLTRIGILTEVVRHHIGAGHAEDSRLASIARLARDSVGAMSDIVWAINPERDSLVDLARKIRDVAEDLAAGSGLDLDLGLPGAASNTRLDMDVRRDLLLICKETLNNAVRHARARRLCLSLREDGGRLSLDMTDDGIGFDADQGFEGNGLVSMRRRAERIGASLSVRSQPGRGTTVRVELPLRRRARSRRAPTPRGR